MPEASSARSALAVAAAMVAIGLAARVLPHPPNVSPIGSLALFSGAFFASRKIALLVPLAVMMTTDVLLGFHGAMWATYSCFAASVLMGRWIRQRPAGTAGGALRIGGACLAGSVLFFLVTNFAVWLTWYEPTAGSLAVCFTAAIPFFQNTLIGDAAFTTVFFGAAALAHAGSFDRFPVASDVSKC